MRPPTFRARLACRSPSSFYTCSAHFVHLTALCVLPRQKHGYMATCSFSCSCMFLTRREWLRAVGISLWPVSLCPCPPCAALAHTSVHCEKRHGILLLGIPGKVFISPQTLRSTSGTTCHPGRNLGMGGLPGAYESRWAPSGVRDTSHCHLIPVPTYASYVPTDGRCDETIPPSSHLSFLSQLQQAGHRTALRSGCYRGLQPRSWRAIINTSQLTQYMTCYSSDFVSSLWFITIDIPWLVW